MTRGPHLILDAFRFSPGTFQVSADITRLVTGPVVRRERPLVLARFP